VGKKRRRGIDSGAAKAIINKTESKE